MPVWSSMAVTLMPLAWSAVMAGDEGKLLPLLRANPALLAERGPVGETPFLMLVLYGKVQLAKRVAGLYPEVVDGRYEGGEYHGENALHIAVVQKRIDVARWLVRAEPELLQHRADGAFFAVGQPCNYGQVPLLFAAGTNQPEMFDMLVAEGADPNAVDSFGNNALHVCVEHDLPEMYVHVRQSWARDAGVGLAKAAKSDGGDTLWKRMNGDGLTPLMLAARDGHREMFEALIELEAQVQWSYGPVSCVILPLRELDFIVGEPRGAIEWLVHNNHVEILQTTRVRELLDKKWAAFGQRLFMRKFRATCIYLAAFVRIGAGVFKLGPFKLVALFLGVVIGNILVAAVMAGLQFALAIYIVSRFDLSLLQLIEISIEASSS